jgi:hypothetical protein
MDGKTQNNITAFIKSINFFQLKATPGNIYFLGVASIAVSWIYGVPGIILGRYALKLHKNCKSMNEQVLSATNTHKLKYGRCYALAGLTFSYIILFATLLVLFLSLIS